LGGVDLLKLQKTTLRGGFLFTPPLRAGLSFLYCSYYNIPMTLQQRNLLFAVLVIILLAGGIYYYKKNQTEALLPEPADTTQNIEKWDTAMNNAHKSFGAGDYAQAVSFFQEALTYNNRDEPYSGLSFSYGAQGNWVKAREAIDSAISLNPLNTEYWNWKMTLLDEKTSASWADLKKVYNEALPKVDPKTKVNLVVYFAAMAEKNGEKTEAIALWEYAIELYPQNTLIYQGEIDRLAAS